MARRLQYYNPKAVDSYVFILDKMLSAANVAPIVISLEISIKNTITLQDTEKYETIDKRITKCMLKAEKIQETVYGWCSILSRASNSPQLH